LPKNRKKGKQKMKNIDEKILMAEEEIKQLQNKKPLTNAARCQARHQNHDCRRNHRLHPTTIQKKPIRAELLPRH